MQAKHSRSTHYIYEIWKLKKKQAVVLIKRLDTRNLGYFFLRILMNKFLGYCAAQAVKIVKFSIVMQRLPSYQSLFCISNLPPVSVLCLYPPSSLYSSVKFKDLCFCMCVGKEPGYSGPLLLTSQISSPISNSYLKVNRALFLFFNRKLSPKAFVFASQLFVCHRSTNAEKTQSPD